jgi:IS30 family transposase
VQHEKVILRGVPLRIFGQAAYIRVIMQKYKQLSLEYRHQIKALMDAGLSQTKIAQTIGVHKSTISRELSRNVAKRGPTAKTYLPDLAQKKTEQRHRDKPKHLRFSELLKKQAADWLEEEKLSPELIAARWRKQDTQGVSHEWLYQWIWKCKHHCDPEYGHLYKELKHGRRKRKRGNYTDSRGILTGRVPIEQRPQVVSERSRLGDLEIDLMMGKAHKSALLVITDRTTLLTAIEKVSSRKARTMATTIIEKLRTVPNSFIKTITVDNDKAFANHQQIASELGADVYFTRPYTSQDKGTVENRIGVIRRFFPKGTDLRAVDHQRIKTVERHINNRPVRKFNYLTPIQQSLKHRAVALIT